MHARIKKQETAFQAGAETVQLRTFGGETGLLLERESSATKKREGDVRVTQVLLATPPNVTRFLAAEPYQEVAPIVRHWVGDSKLPAANDSGSSDQTREEVLDSIAQVPSASDESVLINITRGIIHALGADVAFFFLAEKGTSGTPESFRILVLSGAHVSQTYVDHRWYATDPLMTHAGRSERPYFSSDVGMITSLSGSQRDMAEFARKVGFASCVALPAHSLESNKFGVLYAANSRLPEDGGEEPLRTNWRLFKLLSDELLRWYITQGRVHDQRSTNLSQIELSILNARDRGEHHEMIVEQLGISMRELLRKHLPSIRAKLSVDTIDAAVVVARERSLLASASERKVCYVIYSPRWGVFLRREGSLGTMQFWSSSPYEIDDAETFPDAHAAHIFIQSLASDIGAEMHRVEIHYSAHRASISDCIASGLPGWEPSPVTSGAPADDSGTWGTLEDPSAKYH